MKTRIRFLARQYRALYGMTEHRHRFYRGIAKLKGMFLEIPRDASGRPLAVYLLDAGGQLVAIVNPSGTVSLKDEDFRLGRDGLRWIMPT